MKVITREIANAEYFNFDNLSILSLTDSKKLLCAQSFKKILFTLTRKSKALEDSIVSNNIHLIHAHFGVDAVYALKLAKKNNVPLITTFHGYDITRLPKFTLFPLSWMIYNIYFEKLKKEGDVFIAVSNYIKEKLEKAGFPKEKIVLHHIGIDVDKIPYKKVRNNREVTILAVGRLTEKKGTIYLLKAFEELYQKHKNIKLILVGDGPLKEKLMQFTDDLKSKSKIVFKGALKHIEVINEMLNADIFCFPSITAGDGDQEGLGMVQLEAAATGLPVVASDSGGIKDGIIHNQTGYLVREKDVKQLTEGIGILIENKKLREELGSHGRENMEKNFNINTQSKMLEQIYKETVEK